MTEEVKATHEAIDGHSKTDAYYEEQASINKQLEEQKEKDMLNFAKAEAEGLISGEDVEFEKQQKCIKTFVPLDGEWIEKKETVGFSPQWIKGASPEYIESVNKRIEDIYAVPTRMIDGVEVPLDNKQMNVEAQCLSFFVQAINYNKEVCELLLDDNSTGLRNEVMNLGLPYLAIKVLGK